MMIFLGKTMRQEIHSILNDIQRKYADQWQAHEKKIQLMQSQAENEIQYLMTNIVGKYMHINDLKNPITRNATDFFVDKKLISQQHNHTDYEKPIYDQSQRYSKPLFIDTSPSESRIQHYLQRDSKDLLLKVAEPRKCSSNITSALTSFEKMEPSSTRLLQPWNEQTSQNDIFTQTQTQIQTSPEKTSEKTKKANTNPPFSLIPKKVAHKKDVKDNLKEFWRHRLLQPNPTDALKRENEQKDSIMRNQF